MKSLALAAVLLAAVSASKLVDHMSDKLHYSGSGSFALGMPSQERPLEQFYNYTNGTLYNQTTEVIPNDGNSQDTVNVTWVWYFTAGYSGRYTSAPELFKPNIQNFQYMINLMCNAKT